MAFCDHCQGQRFDRSRILRKLRELRRELHANGKGPQADEAIEHALNTVRALDIPHLEFEDYSDDVVVH